MKLILALSALLCATAAAPSKPIVVQDLHPVAVHAAPAPAHAAVVAAPVAVVSSQSHAQDELGQYSYSYSNPLSSKVETKTVDGITRGGYAYLDSHGLVQSVNYVSDDVNGFRVAASNLPLGPVTPQHDEPLVAIEKAKAVAALHEAAAHEASAYKAAAYQAAAHEAAAHQAVANQAAAYNAAAHEAAAYKAAAHEAAAHEASAHQAAANQAAAHQAAANQAAAHQAAANQAAAHQAAANQAAAHQAAANQAAAHQAAANQAAAHQAAANQAAAHEAAIAHENEVSHGPAPVYLEAPVAHAPVPTPVVFVPAAPTVVHAAPSAPAAHEVHVTPAPVTYVSHAAPSPAPVVTVTPAPYHVPTPAPPSPYVAHATPSAYSAPAEHAHSYATVELDSSDFPPPSPQVYFHPSSASGPHNLSPSPQPTAFPAEPSPSPVLVSSPSPSPVVYGAPDVHASPVHSAPAHSVPLAHDTPVVHAAPAPAAVVAAPVAVVSSQSHAQDELGQYSYSYSNPLSSKVETKTVDGITRGGYAYLDSHGLVQSVNYVSDDHNGFRVAASNLPTAAVPVDIPDSHDVAAAKHVFFAELAKAKAAAEAAPDHPHSYEH